MACNELKTRKDRQKGLLLDWSGIASEVEIARASDYVINAA